MRTAPLQKPGRSEQVVATPPEFIAAVLRLLRIKAFCRDLAANEQNRQADFFLSEREDALSERWKWHDYPPFGGLLWQWLNPPFSDIAPWAEKCWSESRLGAHIALLVPASPGAKWWHDHVRGKGYVIYLRQRIKFVGHTHYYPKDLALILYAPYLEGGERSWRWNDK
jgi:hypothetical protein